MLYIYGHSRTQIAHTFNFNLPPRSQNKDCNSKFLPRFLCESPCLFLFCFPMYSHCTCLNSLSPMCLYACMRLPVWLIFVRTIVSVCVCMFGCICVQKKVCSDKNNEKRTEAAATTTKRYVIKPHVQSAADESHETCTIRYKNLAEKPCISKNLNVNG